MLAFTGALVQSYGMHFDGKMNGMFYEKGVNPFEVASGVENRFRVNERRQTLTSTT